MVAVAAGNRNQVAAAGGLADAGSCRSSAGVAWSNISYDRQRLAKGPLFRMNARVVAALLLLVLRLRRRAVASMIVSRVTGHVRA